MLFEDNFNFIGYDFINNLPIENKNKLTSVDNGFAKGNMFEDLYDPYKNYQVLKPMPKSQ